MTGWICDTCEHKQGCMDVPCPAFSESQDSEEEATERVTYEDAQGESEAQAEAAEFDAQAEAARQDDLYERGIRAY